MKKLFIFIFLAVIFSISACDKSNPPAAVGQTEANAHEENALAQRVTIDPVAIQEANIAIGTSGPATLHESLPLYGIVQPNAERVRNVVARFPGVVKSVEKTLGDTVVAGAVLATIESNDSLQTYAIKAPIGGVITARNINTGENVAEQTLFTLTDLSSVWIELSVFSRDAARIHLGQNVRVRTVDNGTSANGLVVWISPLSSAANQSLTARVQIDNSNGQWTPGLYVVGEVAIAEHAVAVAVQSGALQTLDSKTVIFIEINGGFEPKPVTIGREDDTLSEISAGLAPGTRYVSANSFVIKAELEKSSAEHSH